VAKWLRGLDGKINIHANNNAVFSKIYLMRSLEIAEWMNELDDNNDYVVGMLGQ